MGHLLLIIFHDSLILFVPLTLGSLKNHVSFPNLLKFHNNESVPRYISTYCGRHLVCPFNIEMCFLQFWSILFNYFIDNFLLCTFSLQFFHKSFYLAIEIPDYAQLFSLWLLISIFSLLISGWLPQETWALDLIFQLLSWSLSKFQIQHVENE